MTVTHDPITAPAHYTAYPVQPIEICRHLGFCLGNVVKYVLRAPHKGGVEDLQKALRYLEMEKARHEATRFNHTLPKDALHEFLGSVGCKPGPPEGNVAFSVETNVLPEAYALSVVEFLLELYIYLFCEKDYPESSLHLMEVHICDLIDELEGNPPQHTYRLRNPMREKTMSAILETRP